MLTATTHLSPSILPLLIEGVESIITVTLSLVIVVPLLNLVRIFSAIVAQLAEPALTG